MEKSFALKEVIWLEAERGESYRTFENYIARQEVAVVLLMIEKASHSFQKAKQFCARYGKPFVWISAGRNPNQIAAQIMAQASERLRG